MAFDQTTRNRLATFVSQARTLLSTEFTRQLQADHGLDPSSGEVAPLTSLRGLDDAGRAIAEQLRGTLEHYLAGSESAKARKDALDRIVREQAFTILNRLCALRMAEARGLLLESIGRGYQSRGFQLYARLAGSALGETGDAYRVYLFSLFDEFAVDLAVLFDRFNAQGRLFPRESALLALLALINAPDLEALWAEDETIGWIYQYFNSVDERRQMRAASQAPRNSRELAVRNQFFTPRYVVEFLTDNTLGRIWYEMMRGETGLVDQCRYLVRRPVEIFLGNPQRNYDDDAQWVQAALRGDFSQMPARPALNEIRQFTLLLDGFTLQERFAEGDLMGMGNRYVENFIRHGTPYPNDALVLWMNLFAYQHGMFQDVTQDDPTDPIVRALRALYAALRQALQNPPDDLSQEELLRQPVFIPPRTIKDPRTLKLLDPACGSMHFGLYAFDLFEAIYEEAWTKGLIFAREFGDGDDAYANFRRAIPRLIIENNLHGIDIDPRAVQIAGLSLWLRAQRSWHSQGIKPADRPTITRSNIVCAEPMPGDTRQLEEFLKQLRDQRLQSLIQRVIEVQPDQRVRATPAMADALCDLVRTIWQEMRLAGEAGSLLKIEEALTAAIAKGRAEWEDKFPLFRVETFRMTENRQVEKPKVNYVQFVPGEDVDFWDRAEALVLAALEEYAEQAESDQSYGRRLFAQDAARGFAFIDLCHKRYDVILMNPPFGEPAELTRTLFKSSYPTASDNVAVCFLIRGEELLVPSGLTGAIADCSWAKKYDYRNFRSQILERQNLCSVIHLGWGVLDNANVETNMSIRGGYSMVAFTLNVASTEYKQEVMATASSDNPIGSLYRYLRFSKLPNFVFAFEMRDNEFAAYAVSDFVSSSFMHVVAGVKSCDSTADFRTWWEVPQNELGSGGDWQLLQNGSPYSPFHYPAFFAVRTDKGAWTQLMANGGARPGESYYGKLGVAYGKRTDTMYGYLKPPGQIFSQEGQAIFAVGDTSIWAVLALANSSIFARHANYVAGQHKYHNYLNKICINSQRLPTNNPDAERAYLLLRMLDTANETTHLYMHPGLRAEFDLLKSQQERASMASGLLNQIVALHESINHEICQALGLDDPDDEVVNQVDYYSHYFGESFSPHLVASVWLSFAVGCLFGRWDIRSIFDDTQKAKLPDVFSPLPVSPLGMLKGNQGLPALPIDIPTNYPVQVMWSGISVDDQGHMADIEYGVRQVLSTIWGNQLEYVEQELMRLLDITNLREYFCKSTGFFEAHLNNYSKSRRAAPIYWPLSTTSGSYTLWLYYHRLTSQTLYGAVNDFVDPKINEVAEQLATLQRKPNRSSQETRELEQLASFDQELATFRAELLRVAAFWKPNLNDGVQITAAPLHRLFNHRPWSKRIKETWEKLEEGEYDWAHLAYSIWPDRVREKCRTDKSLAIAHDLESLYVAPPAKAKKPSRKASKAALVDPDAEQAEMELDDDR